MSKARDEYFNQTQVIFKDISAERYISELEQDKAELLKAIENLWRSHRPLSYNKAEHLKQPLVNIISDKEKLLIKIFIKQKYDEVK